MEPLGLSIPDTGKALGGSSRNTIYRLINRGKLKKVKIGARSLVTVESIKAYAAELVAA